MQQGGQQVLPAAVIQEPGLGNVLVELDHSPAGLDLGGGGGGGRKGGGGGGEGGRRRGEEEGGGGGGGRRRGGGGRTRVRQEERDPWRK